MAIIGFDLMFWYNINEVENYDEQRGYIEI